MSEPFRVKTTLEGWVCGVRGRVLERVVGEFHEFEGEIDPEPLRLWLHFEGANPIRFFGASDGWFLKGDGSAPFEVDMGKEGKTKILDITGERSWKPCVGSLVSGVNLLRSSESNLPFGLELIFEPGHVMFILNWGDEMWVSEGMPPDARPEEFVRSPVL